MKFSDVYPLKPFQVSDPDKLRHVISEYPLATVISQGGDYPAVSQIPLIYDPDTNVLQGHVDRNNPHCVELKKEGKIYSVFSGPNHYISPSIYPDSQFPGWNYISVHVEGTVRTIEDHAWLEKLLIQTAEENEPPDSGYRLTAKQDRFDTLIKYILGFGIAISDMRGVLKLAQDKGEAHAMLAMKHVASIHTRDLTDFLTEMLSAGSATPRS